MNRAEQLTRELYVIHKSGEHAVAYAVARIMALEELVRDLVDNNGECMCDGLRASIEELVPDRSTFDEEEEENDDV